jgi:Mu transposase, C-terminal
MENFIWSNSAACWLIHSNVLKAANIDENAIWRGCEDNRLGLSTWQHLKKGNNIWIAYNTIPPLTRQRIDIYLEPHGGLEAAAQKSLLEDYLTAQRKADDYTFFIKEAKSVYHASFSEQKVHDLARACAWLRVCEKVWRIQFDSKFYRCGDKSRQKVANGEILSGLDADLQWQKAAWLQKVVDLLMVERLYGLRVSNVRVLERKIIAWMAGGHATLICGSFETKNAKKISDDERERIIVLQGKQGTNAADIHSFINKEREGQGLQAITLRRTQQIIQKTAAIWVQAKYGLQEARNLREPNLKRRALEVANELWDVDGTTVQLYADISGKVMKTWYIVWVSDAATGAVVGWELGGTETSALVQAAFKSAMTTHKVAPTFWRSDWGEANMSKATQALMQKTGATHFKGAAKTSKSRLIERVGGQIESIMAKLPNFVGSNVTSNRNRTLKANPDKLKKLIKSGEIPTAEQVKKQVAQVVHIYNSKVEAKCTESRIERYRKMESNGTMMNEELLATTFWTLREDTVLYSKEGMTIQIDGTRYTYIVEEEKGIESEAFRDEYLNERFKIRYDPDDLATIRLYDRFDGKHIAAAVQKHAFGAVSTVWMKGEGATIKKALKTRANGQKARDKKYEKYEGKHDDLAEGGFELTNKDALNEFMEGYEAEQAWSYEGAFAANSEVETIHTENGLYGRRGSMKEVE